MSTQETQHISSPSIDGKQIDVADLVANSGVLQAELALKVMRRGQPVTVQRIPLSNRKLVEAFLSLYDAVEQPGNGSVEMEPESARALLELGALLHFKDVPQEVALDVPFLPESSEPPDTNDAWTLNPDCSVRLAGEPTLRIAMGQPCLPVDVAWVVDRRRLRVTAFRCTPRQLKTLAAIDDLNAPSDEFCALLRAGLIVGRSYAAEAARAEETAYRHFLDTGYLVLRGALGAPLLGALQVYYRALYAEGYFEPDRAQVPGGRDGLHNEAWCGVIQRLFVPSLSRIVGVATKPTYSWVYRYRPGARLQRHIDREQCRWNVSICLEQATDPPWPLYLETARGICEVSLNPGDAVLYSGTHIPHWRETLSGTNPETILFWHYVHLDFEGGLD